MTTKTWVITLTYFLLALTATAQDPGRTFHDAIVKRQLYLRSFSVDPRVRGHWDAATNTLIMETPKVHSLAVFTARSVKVKGTSVEIRGNTQILARDSATHIGLLPDESDMVIQLDLRGADMNAVLPSLFSTLFYANQAEALAALPKMYRNILPMKVNDKCCGPSVKTAPRAETCDCADPNSSPCPADGGSIPKGAKPPRLTYQVDPEFSEKARQAKFSGNVEVSLKVDATGATHDLWIIRAVGMDLDAKAGEAVSQYKFAPATCHGIPIPVALYIEVNFQIF
jgi:TonB family protein